jgi:NADP-dependent 3-hydroxy acid dehydrogenase YdfG
MKELELFAPQSLSGKTVFVTGGTTGIGRSTARILAGLGARVFITGRNAEPLEEAIRDTKAMYPDAQIEGITADLAEEQGITAVFNAVRKAFGGLDILVNNAGLAFGGMTEGTYADWQYIVNTNLLSYMACANAAAAIMKEAGKGHILNIGSMSAETRNPESTVYVATKTGVRGFTASLRKELNPLGIKVTLLEPGLVDSDMQSGTTAERQKKIDDMEMLTAEDLAASVVYCLAQPQRSNVASLQVRPLKELI